MVKISRFFIPSCFILCLLAFNAFATGDEACSTCRKVISVPGHDSGDTSTMTNDGGPRTSKDAWYKLEIPSGASCTVTICLSAPESNCWDTYLSLYDSTCATVITYSDDDPECTSDECPGGPWGNSTDETCQSVITRTLTAGTYYICCEGYYSYSEGPYCLEVEGTCSGCNCAYAYPISCDTDSLIDENNAIGPPGINCYSSYSGGWDESGPEKLYLFSNTTANDQLVTISLENLDIGEDLDIFALNSCSNSSFDDDDTTLWIYVPAGESYYISVDGYLARLSELV